MVRARKCNFTDFENISVLQINWSNTQRVGPHCGFAAIDSHKNNVEMCKNAFFCKSGTP